MTRKPLFFSILAFVMAVVLAFVTALILAGIIERRTETSLAQAFEGQGISWVHVAADGLGAKLTGTAPDESARIRALRVAGAIIDASRVSDDIEVPVRAAVVAPVFRIEIMRDRQNLSIIGLVPELSDSATLVERLEASVPDVDVSDMLQSADHAVPEGWATAVDFAVRGLAMFDVGRISVTAGRIEVEALVDTPEAGAQLDARLREIAPRGQVLALQLTPPRPVAAPFLLRLDMENGVPRLGACSADTEAAQAQIRAALRAAGLEGRINCPLALGAPSPRWGAGAAAAIAALAQLQNGSLTLSDGEVTLSVPHAVAATVFDRTIGRLETQLPEAFSLSAHRLDAPEVATQGDDGRPEVSITLTEAGQLTLEGRLPDARIRAAVAAFARARFGAQAVEIAARVDDGLPQGWSIRVLTALEALAELHHGSALVLADRIEITGESGNPDAASQVTQAIIHGLGADAEFTQHVTYVEALDPVAQAPTPDRCEARIHTILNDTKITFDPGSIAINEPTSRVLDAIAEVLRDCGELPFEVAGYTDSQGRDETNLGLSQARAEAVINALMTRRVLVSSLVAHGYGAEHPIADNATEAGREANRRIEFTLIRPEPDPEPLDPALEATLVFDIQTPDGDTTRPQPRPDSLVAPDSDEATSDTAEPPADATPPTTP